MNINNTIYKNIEHFRTETQMQSKFFKNLSLNEYRKAIAERYGYKGIKLFEQALTTIKVTVIAHKNNNGEVNHTWYKEPAHARCQYELDKEESLLLGKQISIYTFETSSYDNTNKELNNVNHSLLINQSNELFPYPKDIWSNIVNYKDSCEDHDFILIPEQITFLRILLDFRKDLKRLTFFYNLHNPCESTKAEYFLCIDNLNEICIKYGESGAKPIDLRIIINVLSEEYLNLIKYKFKK
jgi:hypothetical protein